MNQYFQHIFDLLQQAEPFSTEQKTAIITSLKNAEKEMAIVAFKLDRTEKVKRTTGILLEETIEELEQKRKAVEESNLALQKTLEDLKAAQDQLVQQEKLASLGQLTAGIAHEIKNPLNFVNNFSELSIELIDEVFEEMEQLDKSETTALIREILNDVKSNLQKVNEHGTRADSIVKSMLMHSRGSSGKKTPTDLNRLIRDNATLTFHAMRAGKNPINVKIEYDLDERIGEVSIISEDFSRVIVNLCSNAFDAMREKTKTEPGCKPVLSMSTKQKEKAVEIAISDNGPGIPNEIKDKIFQPFFTTKPTGQGTGLGLSLSYDIVKAHGGELMVETKPARAGSGGEGEGLPADEAGTEFIIQLPIT